MTEGQKVRALTRPSRDEIRKQIAVIKARQYPGEGKRQVPFVPVEVLLCLAASLVVKYNSYGGANAHLAPSPVPQLARLFKRPPGSIISKMGNLYGGRANGGVGEVEAAKVLLEDRSKLESLYLAIVEAARDQAIGVGELPDFLPRHGR